MENVQNEKLGQPHSDADIIVQANIILIDVEDFGLHQRPHPAHDPGVEVHYHYIVKVDQSQNTFTSPFVTGADLMAVSGKDSARFRLIQLLKGPGHQNHTRVIALDETVDLRGFGIERFVTEAIAITFYIDQQDYQTQEPCLTVRQILVDFAGVDPSEKTLADKQNCSHEYKNLDEAICLHQGQTFTLFDNAPTQVS
ncbi:multiubiquitin domain-containing protein [Dyadobacter sp. BHUBP1]|uniref:multiubiquitin domain-containing protein n=1 Tax=Dyadobacter sp. BHUBP1 TaxID=3424178 RepID=UPI003D32EA66